MFDRLFHFMCNFRQDLDIRTHNTVSATGCVKHCIASIPKYVHKSIVLCSKILYVQVKVNRGEMINDLREYEIFYNLI